jgi:hypothetical protein
MANNFNKRFNNLFDNLNEIKDLIEEVQLDLYELEKTIDEYDDVKPIATMLLNKLQMKINNQ